MDKRKYIALTILAVFVAGVQVASFGGSLLSRLDEVATFIRQLFISSKQSMEYRFTEDGLRFPGGFLHGFPIIKRDVPYSRVGGVTLTMDLYFPHTPKLPQPAVIYIHGGAWALGSKDTGPGLIVLSELVKNGYIVAAVQFRLAPKFPFPAQLIDIKSAVKFLRENASLYGIDPSRIGAFGTSSGGHLASLAGLTGDSPSFRGTEYVGVSDRLAAVANLYGPIDLEEIFPGIEKELALSIFGRGEDSLKFASPIHYIDENAPPFLIVQGDKDVLIPPNQLEKFCEALSAKNNQVRLLVVKNAGHGLVPEGGTLSPSLTEVAAAVVAFFDEQLAR